MIVEGIRYDDEEWRIVRVQSAPTAGREHRITTHHHGEPVGKSFVCYDCKTVYFEEGSSVQEDPPATVPVTEKFLMTIVGLAVEYGVDLGQLQKFMEAMAAEHCPGWIVPNLIDMRNERYGEDPR